MRTALRLGLLVALSFAATAAATARAHPGPQVPEYDVKTAYLFNFAKFVEWPDDAFAGTGHPLSLCVYGEGPFEDALAAIHGKSIGDRHLVAAQVHRIQLVDGCHILFIPRSAFRLAGEILARAASSRILTVTEAESPNEPRGIINLVRRDDRVAFQIDPKAAARVGLRISSRLLQLAEVTTTAPWRPE